MTIADLTGRADAKTTISILNANRPCAEHRTSDARPYGCAMFLRARVQKNYSIVTGRDTGNNDYLKCSNDREKSASTKKKITIVTGRDTGNKNY